MGQQPYRSARIRAEVLGESEVMGATLIFVFGFMMVSGTLVLTPEQ